MTSPKSEILSSYARNNLLREARGVETWEVEGDPGHHLLKISQGPEVHFKKEYQFLSEAAHPGFPRPVAWRQEGDREIYLREYLGGAPLSEYFGKLPGPELGALLAKILRSLSFLHYRGWAHGDLSGSNILVEENGRVVLIDMEFLSLRHQAVEAVRGTPVVMAPELFWGRPPTIQTDLYAFGCLMYALISGHYPFQESGFSALLQCHALEEPSDPTKERSDLPSSLGWIALRLLAKEPGSRFAEANDVIHAINRALWLHESIEVPPPKITSQQRLKVAETFSQQQEAIRHLREKKNRSAEETKTLAELFLKTGRHEDLEQLIPDLPRASIHLYLGLLLNQRGQYSEALGHWESVTVLKDSQALLGRATAYYYSGEMEKAFRFLEQAPVQDSPRAEAVLKNFQGNLLLYERRLDEAAEIFGRALALAQDSGAVALEALVRMNLANVLTAQQRWESALDNYLKADELYAALGLFLQKAKCDLNLSGLFRFFGHLERSEELLREAKAQLKKTPQRQLESYAALLEADLHKKRGIWEAALTQLKAPDLVQQKSSAADLGDLFASTSEILLAQGEEDALIEELKKARCHAKKTADGLLAQRVDLLERLQDGFHARRFDSEVIGSAVEALWQQGDVEFVLDNLLTAKNRALGQSIPWNHELHHLCKGLTENTSSKFPPDYQSFFRHQYRKLLEVSSMNESLVRYSPMEDPKLLLDTVLDWVRDLSGETSLSELSRKILHKLLEFTHMERGFVILKEGDHWTVLQNHRISQNEFKEDGEEKLSWSLTRKAFEQGKPLATTHAETDPRLQTAESVQSLQLKAILVLPFHCRGRVLGAVYLDSRLRGEHLESTDLPMLESLAEILGLAVENASRFEKNEQALEEAKQDLARARREMGIKYRYEGVLGRSQKTQEFLQRVDRVTEVRVPVLIQGESGVGKELVARAIHFNGSLKKGPFIAANCSAIPEGLIESEFFGYERGAFTGALQQKVGLFEAANGGTLFLDEIGDMPLSLQAKLLRILQEGEVRRLGSNVSHTIHVRLLAATHRDLKDEIAKGRFREDLFYRMNVAGIKIPPLRERLDDIPILVSHFLEKFAQENQAPKKRMSSQVLAKLMDYAWPGNIRELENLVYNLCVFSESKSIQLEDLAQKPELCQGGMLHPEKIAAQGSDPLSSALDSGDISLSEAKRLFEKREIERVLAMHQGRVGTAAEQLGILRPQLSRLISYHGLKRAQ